MVIKAAVFNSEKTLGSLFSQSFNYHKAFGKSIELSVAPNKTYDEGGKEALINSIKGSESRYGDKEWLGFLGEDVEIIIDLEEAMQINSIAIRFFNSRGQWIYAPINIEVVLDDQTKSLEIPQSNELIVNTNMEVDSKTRYIKIKINKYGLIPDGSQGSGNQAWTFIDEIIVN